MKTIFYASSYFKDIHKLTNVLKMLLHYNENLFKFTFKIAICQKPDGGFTVLTLKLLVRFI